MRKNLPVTQREYPFPPGETIVSSTDLQGRIRYCNRTFVEVSGFDHETLIGSPHGGRGLFQIAGLGAGAVGELGGGGGDRPDPDLHRADLAADLADDGAQVDL